MVSISLFISSSMSNPYFRFKQFTVYHDRCAMKVGTDGCLLGAWTPLPSSTTNPIHVLDVGTGSGLIALMLAQRLPNAIIDAIDIDPGAIEQATFNFAQSPWPNRLRAHLCSLQEWHSHLTPSSQWNGLYDLIVSNPPYFINSLPNPDQQRNMARHTDTLSYAELFSCCTQLLSPTGIFSIILPASAESEILSTLNAKRSPLNAPLSTLHTTRVYSKPNTPPLRTLMAFSHSTLNAKRSTLSECPEAPLNAKRLTLTSSSSRSPEYTALMQDFYL